MLLQDNSLSSVKLRYHSHQILHRRIVPHNFGCRYSVRFLYPNFVVPKTTKWHENRAINMILICTQMPYFEITELQFLGIVLQIQKTTWLFRASDPINKLVFIAKNIVVNGLRPVPLHFCSHTQTIYMIWSAGMLWWSIVQWSPPYLLSGQWDNGNTGIITLLLHFVLVLTLYVL